MAQSAWHYAPVADRHDSDREVLTSLPRTRPVRRSAKRGDIPRSANATKEKPKAAAAKAPKAAAPTAPKARTTAAKPRSAAQPKATARAARPAGAGTTAPRSRTAPRRAVPPAGYASPSQTEDDQRSASADLIGTVVQAATELAQIGCAVGRQALQSMLDRLPKP
jgi:hypothetical protein